MNNDDMEVRFSYLDVGSDYLSVDDLNIEDDTITITTDDGTTDQFGKFIFESRGNLKGWWFDINQHEYDLSLTQCIYVAKELYRRNKEL